MPKCLKCLLKFSSTYFFNKVSVLYIQVRSIYQAFWRVSHGELLEREAVFSQIVPVSYTVDVTDALFHILGTAEKDLESAKLVQILHRLLADDRSAPEIKYNSMVLICALMGSGKDLIYHFDVHKHVIDIIKQNNNKWWFWV